MARTKKEIDKERMYEKLMPSGLKAARAERAAAPAPGAELRAARARSQPHRVAVPALDSRRMAVVNVMEAAVLKKLNPVLERFSCCRCDRCKRDIVALALNKLPPRYRVVAEGQPLPELDQKENARVVMAMIEAVLKVRANPRH
ncbi:MAG TPA: hypothetical protein DEB16_04505 [Ruminococcaceae bacterium]|jgi:hypothetical protein|nr:hypothetical protein [Oscillospiraceae bacterium]HBG56063.1 hypothetical protein [Oscillospiraceae bacterium]HBQ45889.1 hypothetical protein [Oscillospiraceae bacterium]HBT91093.1 hypothetical protein [Oscillospiraceae bacterium]